MESKAESLIPEHTTYRAAILLSAFGDSPYLSEQVHSIVQQMDARDILIIVDDGSRAVPWTAIQTWPKNFLIWSRLQPSGASQSFLSLIVHSTVQAEHYFLSDQDDIWCPGKINLQLLAHTVQGTDFHASTHWWSCMHQHRAPSQLLHLGPPARPLPTLSPAHYCFETPAPGMTLAFDANCRDLIKTHQELLLSLGRQLPHDRLLFALFSLHARIHALDSVLVHYRQHSGNLVGSPPANGRTLWRKRIAWPRRAWRTAMAGAALYQQLMQTRNAPDTRCDEGLSTMRLRSNTWDNRLLHAILCCRTVLQRLQRSR